MTATAAKTQTDAPAFEFLGVIHEGIPVPDALLEDCIEFYTQVLGLTQIPRPPALDEFGRGAWLRNDDDSVQFHLIANDRTKNKPAPGDAIEPDGRHTAWRLADTDAFKARMEALGVVYKELGNLIGEPQLFVTDPAGHTWEFQGPTAPGPGTRK